MPLKDTAYDSSDRVRIAGGTADGSSFTTGTTGSVVVGGVYKSSVDTLTDGTTAVIGIDVNRNVKTTLANTIAGEDISNDVQKVEQRFSYTNISTAAGTLVKTGIGVLHAITFNNVGSAWEIDVYDNTTSAATSIAKIRSAAFTSLRYDISFGTGLFIDTVKGTTVGDLTVAWR